MMTSPESAWPVSPSWRRRVVKVAAEAVDLVRPGRPGVVVLIYHRVGRRTSQSVDLPVEQFDARWPRPPSGPIPW